MGFRSSGTGLKQGIEGEVGKGTEKSGGASQVAMKLFLGEIERGKYERKLKRGVGG